MIILQIFDIYDNLFNCLYLTYIANKIHCYRFLIIRDFCNKNIPLRYKKENYKLNAPFGCKTILHYCFIYQNGIFANKIPRYAASEIRIL